MPKHDEEPEPADTAKTLGYCIGLIDLVDRNQEEDKRIVRTLAAYYGVALASDGLDDDTR